MFKEPINNRTITIKLKNKDVVRVLLALDTIADSIKFSDTARDPLGWVWYNEIHDKIKEQQKAQLDKIMKEGT